MFMIEQGLFFSLGLLVAALIWLLLLPAFWRRAMRLSQRRLEESLPLSLNEMRAGQDVLRASEAVTLTRMRDEVEAMRLAIARAKAETGARLVIESKLLDEIATHKAEIARLEGVISMRDDRIAMLDGELAAMTTARNEALAMILALESERADLRTRLAATFETAEARRIALDDATLRGERAQNAYESEAQRSIQLRSEVQNLSIALRMAERELETIAIEQELARIRQVGAAPAADAAATSPPAS